MLGADYWEKLRDLYSPVLMTRVDEMFQKVVIGEADLTTNGTSGRSLQLWEADNTVKLKLAWPTEGLTAFQGHIAALAKAPHPNAAKLFLELALSKEYMQWWMVDGSAKWPLRSDVKVEGPVAQFMKHGDDVKWIRTPWADVTNADRQKLVEEFRKIFGA